MRTTLDIDADVLEIARGLASHRKQSIGRVVSDLCRKNIQFGDKHQFHNGLRVIQRETGAVPVTLETVNRLRDESP